MTFGRSIGSGVILAVFPEDLRVSEKMIFDPLDKTLLLWNKIFLLLCILAVCIDPLFLYLPEFNPKSMCLGVKDNLAYSITAIRTVIDVFYLLHIALQFHTAYIAPSSRVSGRRELVVDPAQIAKRYIGCYFFVDLLAVLPLPQIVVWSFLQKKGQEVLATKTWLLWIVFIQYIPRFLRFIPLTSELKKTMRVFAESALADKAYFLLWYLLLSHIVGAFWYLLAIERYDTCWVDACRDHPKCNEHYLYCGSAKHMPGLNAWKEISSDYLIGRCSGNSNFDYGIYGQAEEAVLINKYKVKKRRMKDKDTSFFYKVLFCLFWGLQNLSSHQGIETSTYYGEVLFYKSVTLIRFILFTFLIGDLLDLVSPISIWSSILEIIALLRQPTHSGSVIIIKVHRSRVNAAHDQLAQLGRQGRHWAILLQMPEVETINRNY